MKILSINAGSSSLKFTLFELPKTEAIASGVFEKIGLKDSFYTIKYDGEKTRKEVYLKDHSVAVDYLIKDLVDMHIVSSLNEIEGVGHRILHGGAEFTHPVVLNEDVVARISKYNELGPLHNPANLLGVEAFMKALPGVINVGVFDTGFHQTMDEEHFLYPVPYEWYENLKVRKYGAHGTSHQYVMKRTAELMGKDYHDLNMITCHLGNGASITAIKNGKVYNTSMGLSPLGGIMMGTRCGDIDPTVVYYVEEKLGLSAEEMDVQLNKKSGMLGISGISSDSRDVEQGVKDGNPRAILTSKLYTQRVVDFIGSYYMELGHVDAIAFTAGLGEHATEMRERVLSRLEEGMGVKVDYALNAKTHSEAKISTADSKVEVWIVPTNEELVIARDTVRLLGL